MKISEIARELQLKAVYEDFKDNEVSGAYTSDLLSDVMANAQESQILITIQAHKNTVAVASLMGASAILICNNRPLSTDMVDAAREEGIPIFLSPNSQYTMSGKLWVLLGEK